VTQGGCRFKLGNGMLWPHVRPWEGFYQHVVFIQDDWTSIMHIWTLVPLEACYLEGGALDELQIWPQILETLGETLETLNIPKQWFVCPKDSYDLMFPLYNSHSSK